MPETTVDVCEAFAKLLHELAAADATASAHRGAAGTSERRAKADTIAAIARRHAGELRFFVAYLSQMPSLYAGGGDGGGHSEYEARLREQDAMRAVYETPVVKRTLEALDETLLWMRRGDIPWTPASNDIERFFANSADARAKV